MTYLNPVHSPQHTKERRDNWTRMNVDISLWIKLESLRVVVRYECNVSARYTRNGCAVPVQYSPRSRTSAPVRGTVIASETAREMVSVRPRNMESKMPPMVVRWRWKDKEDMSAARNTMTWPQRALRSPERQATATWRRHPEQPKLAIRLFPGLSLRNLHHLLPSIVTSCVCFLSLPHSVTYVVGCYVFMTQPVRFALWVFTRGYCTGRVQRQL